MNKVLVTGGLGFIGSHFVELCMQRDASQVVVLDSMTYASDLDFARQIKTDGVQVVRGDIRDEHIVDRLVQRCDVVIHLAAESHNDRSISSPQEFVSTNTVGTLNLLEAVRRHDVRFHHVSTDEVYGDLPLSDNSAFTLSSPYRPSSPYSASKAAADHFVRAWHRTYGIAATISNCTNNYGPRQHVEKFIPQAITDIIRDVRPRLYGDGKNVRDWIHVKDHCTGIMAVLDRGFLGETYLIGARNEQSNIAVLLSLLELMGRPASFFEHVADRPGHDARYSLDVDSMTRLDWVPVHTDFVEGLGNTVEWFVANENWWRETKIFNEAVYT